MHAEKRGMEARPKHMAPRLFQVHQLVRTVYAAKRGHCSVGPTRVRRLGAHGALVSDSWASGPFMEHVNSPSRFDGKSHEISSEEPLTTHFHVNCDFRQVDFFFQFQIAPTIFKYAVLLGLLNNAERLAEKLQQ